MKSCGCISHQGTYIPQTGNEKGAGFLPFTGVSTLLQKHCNKKQETEECILKLCGYIYHQGTYTPQAGNEKGAGFLPFTGAKVFCHILKLQIQE